MKETKAIKDFVDMMEEGFERFSNQYLTIPDNYNRGYFNCITDIIEKPEYRVLKAMMKNPDVKAYSEEVSNFCSYGGYPQPEVNKPTYKLSDMWKVWHLNIPHNYGEVLQSVFLTRDLAIGFAEHINGTTASYPALAITKADATEFTEGEGLNN
jgi:hypothetical protein